MLVTFCYGGGSGIWRGCPAAHTPNVQRCFNAVMTLDQFVLRREGIDLDSFGNNVRSYAFGETLDNVWVIRGHVRQFFGILA